MRGLSLGDAYAHQRTSWIDWTAIEPPWLRSLVKRWARQRLLSGRSPNSIRGASASLGRFSRFLRAERIDLREPAASWHSCARNSRRRTERRGAAPDR